MYDCLWIKIYSLFYKIKKSCRNIKRSEYDSISYFNNIQCTPPSIINMKRLIKIMNTNEVNTNLSSKISLYT